jgi:hypothetical protein
VASRIIHQPKIRVFIGNRRGVVFDPEVGGEIFLRIVG